MTDYTPTTEEVREYVSIGGEYRPWDAPDSRKEKAREAAFDRWLSDLKRQIAAEAWDEGWDACTGYVDGPDWGQAPPNPYRADRIEQGEDK